jgi:hypothetical protein
MKLYKCFACTQHLVEMNDRYYCSNCDIEYGEVILTLQPDEVSPSEHLLAIGATQYVVGHEE